VPGALLLALLAFGLRRRKVAVTLVVVAVSLGAVMLPRYVVDEQPQADGPQVRLMAANLNEGQADAETIVNAVRDHAVDVLNLPELSRDAVTALDAAGLAAELPHRVFDPGAGGNGSGIAARYPLRQIALVESSYLAMPSVVVDLPGREDIEVVAVHVLPPMPSNTEIWRRELAGLPDPAPHVRVRVLAGDFNATFDHAAFRGLIGRGYVDAAEQTGSGLVPTWTTGVSGPPVTLDHVLVDGRCAVRDYAVLDVPGTDHDAVFAEIVLP
jgi:endonuclease/exonuclease/phosphatase (EEP) superfamily protein YafD